MSKYKRDLIIRLLIRCLELSFVNRPSSNQYTPPELRKSLREVERKDDLLLQEAKDSIKEGGSHE